MDSSPTHHVHVNLLHFCAALIALQLQLLNNVQVSVNVPTALRHLHGIVTAYCTNHLVKEFNKVADTETPADADITRYRCSQFIAYSITCRHIMAARQAQELRVCV